MSTADDAKLMVRLDSALTARGRSHRPAAAGRCPPAVVAFADAAVAEGSRFIYWGIPAAFALVIWCAVLPALEERVPLLMRRQVTLPAVAS